MEGTSRSQRLYACIRAMDVFLGVNPGFTSGSEDRGLLDRWEERKQQCKAPRVTEDYDAAGMLVARDAGVQ